MQPARFVLDMMESLRARGARALSSTSDVPPASPELNSTLMFGGPIGALIESSTGALLAISGHMAAIVTLSEYTQDTIYAHNVRWPRYLRSFFLASIRPERYPEWKWDHKSRTFGALRSELVTDALRAQAALAQVKLNALSAIIFNLNMARAPLNTGIDLQETVYSAKRAHAESFRDSGYDDARISEFPYVLQYADFAHIEPRAAADMILFKSKMDDDVLAKTELLRLRYFNRIREARAPEEMPVILADFRRDCYVNAQV